MLFEGTRFKRGVFGFALGAIAALTLACGGGDDTPDPTATSGSGGSGNGGATATATATSTSGGGSSGAPSSASLTDLNSYKYSVKMSGTGSLMGDISGGLDELGGSGESLTFEISGAYIKPDKAQTTIKFGSLETSTVVIGNQQWTSAFGQLIGPTPATAADVESANFLSDFWTDDGLGDAIKDFDCGSKENVNGVSATKCNLDKAGFEKMAREDPDFLDGVNVDTLTTANIDAWIADGGYPVRMRMQVAGKDDSGDDFTMSMEMDVTDINGNFEITAPRS